MSSVIHYLDDFFIIGSPLNAECINYLVTLRAIFGDLGVPLVEHKMVGPSRSIDFLGVNLDSISLQLSLPDEKLKELKMLMQS